MEPKRSFACAPPTVPQCVIDPSLPVIPNLPGSNVVCTCQQPVMACEVRITYPQNDPNAISIAPMGPWCDAAGIELAVAVALAKLLGAK